MKKLVVFAALAVFGLTVNAQVGVDRDKNGHFYGGIQPGFPIGDSADFTTFSIAVDLGYLFELSDDFDAGVASGYTHAFGEDGFDDFQFIPVAGSIYFNASESVSFGGDIGYAINAGSGGGGDFYYRPALVYKFDEANAITLDFRTVSGDGVSFSWLGVGYRRSF
ncbi:MAG: hypothetical protein HKN96_08785 [Flavobacteriaceae bacterium]|nr:hypothetical protein [Bacteroidia bacterium]NND11291.1 hypothetical protein [Flavobacteriaceae bacterium]NNK26901.1 hypothetical protein [Flavobacteriaceae bacterium]NNL60501.1 hypothetical protein [Flavobacteriaceae bacterium]